MTSKEFKKARKLLGYTQAEMAIAIGKKLRSVTNYEGLDKVPIDVSILVNLLLEKNNLKPMDQIDQYN